MFDPEKFNQACVQVRSRQLQQGGIGTLGEKALHATIKHYLEADPAFHEQKIGRYYADVQKGPHIYEIQTRQFNKLRAKLEAFLQDYAVTIVYPIPARKWVFWINPETGEVSKPRLSPKRGSPYDAFFELYKIKPWLMHPRFSLHLLMIDLEEYKILNGWSRDKKRGSTRHDRLPVRLNEAYHFASAADFGQLIPPSLAEDFTSTDFAKAAAIPIARARLALNVLCAIGQIEEIGRKGRLKSYQRTVPPMLS